MKATKMILRFLMQVWIVILCTVPFIAGFFLKLFISGFYAGVREAEDFLGKY